MSVDVEIDHREVDRILAEYPGMRAVEVAQFEYGDPRAALWVAGIRSENGYDERGYPIRRWQWDHWDKRERVAKVRELRRRGMSVRRAAEHLGIPASTMQRYLRD